MRARNESGDFNRIVPRRKTGLHLRIRLSREAAEPLYQQIAGQLRLAILSGQLKHGDRLPPTRTLAEDLGCSRFSVSSAYDVIIAEGFAAGAARSGYIVSDVPIRQAAPSPTNTNAGAQTDKIQLSHRGAELLGMPIRDRRHAAFAASEPDNDIFPWTAWSKIERGLSSKTQRRTRKDWSPAGFMPLRTAIATHLGGLHGFPCDADQVFVHRSLPELLQLVARALLDPNDIVWVEDPHFVGFIKTIDLVGARATSIPIDANGFDVHKAAHAGAHARAAIVQPDCQFPSGSSMSNARRTALAQWAQGSNTTIWEARPYAATTPNHQMREPLFALAPERVIYFGSFFDIVPDAARISYAIFPKALCPLVSMIYAGMTAGIVENIVQPIFCEFINQGHLASLIRRSRTAFKERAQTLLTALRRELSGFVVPNEPVETSFLTAELGPLLVDRMSDRKVCEIAASADVSLEPLSRFSAQTTPREGLLFGFSSLPEAEIDPAVNRLRMALAAA